MYEVQINRDQLRAATCTAGARDIRGYLNGVLIEATAGHTCLIATDGSCMSVQVSKAENKGAGSWIMPNETIALVTAKAHGVLYLTSADGENWTLSTGMIQTIFRMVDGKFPNWRRVVQTRISNEVSDYNADILAKFSKAAKILGKKSSGASVWVGQNGDGAGRVIIAGRLNYLGAIMPMRAKDAKTGEVYREQIVNPLLTEDLK
jgi:DNA polymerase-3 subunit beta